MDNLRHTMDGVVLSNKPDSWIWSLEVSGLFSVASARRYIDDILCAWESSPTRWIKSVPIKVNILAWRLSLNKLPTRHNISLRGMDIPSICCPICEVNVEHANHLFFSCMFARGIYDRIFKWCGLSFMTFSSYNDWLTWFNSLKFRKVIKDYLEGIFFVTWWHIWWFRNKIVFQSNRPSKFVVFDTILSHSFMWCKSRAKCNLAWLDWIKSPLLVTL
ncbi:RNA-directed DNA polymerase, eukaryota [Tanacetum coccineum]